MHARRHAQVKIPKKKVIESQTIKYFSAGGEKIEKPKKYYSAIQRPEKVLQRYTDTYQSIVVYLRSRRRRRKKNVCTTFPQGHGATESELLALCEASRKGEGGRKEVRRRTLKYKKQNLTQGVRKNSDS